MVVRTSLNPKASSLINGDDDIEMVEESLHPQKKRFFFFFVCRFVTTFSILCFRYEPGLQVCIHNLPLFFFPKSKRATPVMTSVYTKKSVVMYI